MIRFLISIYFILIFLLFARINPNLYSQQLVENYITDIQFSPDYANDGTLFLSVWKSGLYKSMDGGNSWRKVMELSEDNKWMNVIAMSPGYGTDATVFAGFRNLFRSVDEGSSWQKLTFSAGKMSDITLSPDFLTDQTLYYISYGSSKFSRNIHGGYGQWESLPTTDGYLWNWCMDISPYFAKDSTIFIGRLGEGIRRSRDGGFTLDEIRLEGMAVRDIKISPDFQTDGTLFAATYDGIFFSEDRGDSWKISTTIPCARMVLSPDFPNDRTLFGIIDDGIMKSIDKGLNWQRADAGLTTPYISCLAISPDYLNDHTLFAGAAQGVLLYRSTDGGASWNPVTDEPFGFSMPCLTHSPFIDDFDPSIVAGANGTLHVAWLGAFADTERVRQEVFYMKREHGQWSDPVIITAPTGEIAKEFSLAIDDKSRPHLLMRRGDDNIFMEYEDDVYYSTVSSQGSWANPLMVIDGEHDSYSRPKWNHGFRQIALSLDHGGKAHVAYQTFYGQGFIWYTSNQSGDFFTPPIQILPESMNAISADIAADRTGKVHIAVETFQHGLIYTSNVMNNFSEQIVITAGGKDPIILTDEQDAVHITFYSTLSGKRIGYVNNRAGHFGEPEYIQHYHHPTMTLNDQGNAHIGFQHGPVATGWDELNNDICYANNSGGAFHERILTELTSTIATAQRRYIAVTPDDSVHMVYTVRDDVYHLSFAAGNVTRVRTTKLTPVPETFALNQNYPNPFNPATTISYQLPKSSRVMLQIYNIRGELIRTVVDENQSAGYYSIVWDGRNDAFTPVASGIYFYALETKDFVKTRKMILVR